MVMSITTGTKNQLLGYGTDISAGNGTHQDCYRT